MKTKIQIPDLIILITIASTTLYIISRNLPLRVGSFAAFWAPIALVTIILKRPTTVTKGLMRILLQYGVIMVGILQYTLWKYMNDWNQIHILLEFYYLVVMTAILSYYRGTGDFKRLALLSKWAFIFTIITLITTNIALYFDSYVVRQSAATGKFSPLQNKIYNLTGAMGYSYIQAIVCLIPILIYHVKNKRKMVFSPKVLVAILLLIFITQIRAQVFANVLVTGMITILSFIGSKKRLILFITISLSGILLISTSNIFFADIFYSLSSKFDPDSEIYYKLKDFAVFIKNPEFDTSTGAGGRAERYPLLFKALAANPLLGDASYDSRLKIYRGVHLYWMNRLALWGIPGFLIFVFVLFKIFRSISSLFDADYRFYYFLSVTAFIFLGLTKAVGGREPWLMLIVVIPGLYFLPLLQQAKKTSDSKG